MPRASADREGRDVLGRGRREGDGVGDRSVILEIDESVVAGDGVGRRARAAREPQVVVRFTTASESNGCVARVGYLERASRGGDGSRPGEYRACTREQVSGRTEGESSTTDRNQTSRNDVVVAAVHRRQRSVRHRQRPRDPHRQVAAELEGAASPVYRYREIQRGPRRYRLRTRRRSECYRARPCGISDAGRSRQSTIESYRRVGICAAETCKVQRLNLGRRRKSNDVRSCGYVKRYCACLRTDS